MPSHVLAPGWMQAVEIGRNDLRRLGVAKPAILPQARKLAFEYIPAEPKPKKAKGEDEDEESDEEDEENAALVDATPRKALLAPRDAKKDRPRSSGTVPSVPRRKDD